MDPITQQTLLAAAAAAGGDKVYVDDVFSTFLWTGNDTANRAIVNGIDNTEGGLVWAKDRENANHHQLYDTERGAAYYLETNGPAAQASQSGKFVSFNNNGFTISNTSGSPIPLNYPGRDFVGWNFRKAFGFFDIVTYTGNGTAGKTVSHNLGSVPGMIIIKGTNGSSFWRVYHRELGNTKALALNDSGTPTTNAGFWNNTTPTASVFTVGGDAYNTNDTNKTYVAYIFAHDDAQFGTGGDESIIKCGSYTGDGLNTGGTVVNLGFEPQFVLMKNTTRSSQWMMFDNMRGIANGGNDAFLHPSDTDADQTADYLDLTSTGFKLTGSATTVNQNGDNYIYMAIRRPNKPPEVATDVFNVNYLANGSTNVGFVADANIAKYPAGTQDWYWQTRLTGNKDLSSNTAGTENVSIGAYWDQPNNTMNFGTYNGYYVNYVLKRAPGFYDVVTYAGTSSSRTVSHNLGVVPELILCKGRDAGFSWAVYHAAFGATKYMELDKRGAAVTSSPPWNNTAPTSSVFSTGGQTLTNHNNVNFIAHLFATLPGISKVGSYTGTGSAINVNCGFTNGARFVMIKRDGTGDWYVWDTARGIVSGNDPYLLFNRDYVQVTNTDYIDPLSTGFTVTASAPAALNASGGTYLFLAIA